MANTDSIKCEKIGNTFKVSFIYQTEGTVVDGHETGRWNLLKEIPNNFLEDWAEELQNKEYQQCKHNLCDYINKQGDFGYCCLGVAGKMRSYTDDYMRGVGMLSNSSINKGITRIPKILRENDDCNLFFANLNDNYNFTFSQISLVIEEILKFKEEENEISFN